MKIIKVVLTLIVAFSLTGCFNKQQYGAITINTSQPASVQIDGKDLGATPYKEDKILAGQVNIRLTPQSGEYLVWEEIVDINPGARTIITRELTPTNDKQSGEILTMQKTGQSVASLTVISSPDGAMVKLNGEALGPSPLEKSSINEGENELVLSSPGYLERIVRFKSQNGYKVLVNVDLAKVDLPIILEPEETQESSESASSDSSTTTITTSPTPTPKSSTSSSTGKSVKILTTPTGWLRVRSEPSVNSNEVGRVNPGESYDLLDEDNGWLQIELRDGKKGWIAGQYAQKQ